MKPAFAFARALDDGMRTDHAYLTATDRVWCLAEYQPGASYRVSEVNQMIINLKCRPSIASVDPRRMHYKVLAMNAVARGLRAAISRWSVESATWIPIPPSRPALDADYDDRLERILALAFRGYDLDLRPLLYQTELTAPDHTRARRLSVEALYRIIGLDGSLLDIRPLRACVVLFDDVLTSGKHFKCCERRLRETLAGTPISGLFVARRVLSRRWRCPVSPPHAGAASAVSAAPWRRIRSVSAAATMPVAPANTKAST